MIRFRVYPFREKGKSDTSAWYEVRILKDQKELQQASHETVCPPCKEPYDKVKGALGLCHAHRSRFRADQWGNVLKTEFKGEVGVIFLQENNLEEFTIAHEMTHAMLYVVGRMTNVINLEDRAANEADEYMAGVVGNLVRSFYTNFAKKKK